MHVRPLTGELLLAVDLLPCLCHTCACRLLGGAASRLRAIDAALGQQLDEGAQLQSSLALAQSAFLLCTLCVSLASVAQVEDSTTVYSLAAAALAAFTGSMARLQQQLAALGGLQGAAGSEVQAASQLMAWMLHNGDPALTQRALHQMPGAPAAAFGCSLLRDAGAVLGWPASPTTRQPQRRWPERQPGPQCFCRG